ncbi:hypothetical protein MAL08_15130 [Leptospira noguchii]|uniref:hypothetical protein n=1 Tax=Leptospira noguchii TaxID=28182 RepID=UPI001FB5F3CC|nr:hypothetical protein [Leptospira noguchii]UOG37365.1 hypothetical protein MAL08_15130 [Leptospira noguchii]
MNAYLWVGVQGVVALSLLFAPIFLRRTYVLLLLISIKLSTVNLSQNTDSMQNIKYFII